MSKACEWSPKESDRRWLVNLIGMLNDGGTWAVPATGHVFRKSGYSLVWMNEDMGDTDEIFKRSKMIGQEVGIDVMKESEL